MNTIVYPTATELANAAAIEIIELLKKKPNAVICLASGNSPKLTCAAFVEMTETEEIDTSQFFFIGLDEWIGVPPEMLGSCFNDFQERIFNPLKVPASRYHLFNGLSDDLMSACLEMDQIISSKGGIDLMIVGIGMNGHIGFNEPGTKFELKSHIVSLDPITSSVGQKYFDQQMKLEKGITLGFEHLLQSRRVLLLANGVSKAEVIKQAIEGPVSIDFPASVMHMHTNGSIMVDAAAGSLLSVK
jgi:galactosamine-6-phosphate isomerase